MLVGHIGTKDRTRAMGDNTRSYAKDKNGLKIGSNVKNIREYMKYFNYLSIFCCRIYQKHRDFYENRQEKEKRNSPGER